MSVLSDAIAQYIDRQLDIADGSVDICRSALAENFGCTPSQITYVLRTRFSLIRGYWTESRRGGGGYIRVRRISTEHADCLAEVLRTMLKAPMSRRQAEEAVRGLEHMGVIEEETGRLMLAAVSDEALRGMSREQADMLRAGILAQMLRSRLSALPQPEQSAEE